MNVLVVHSAYRNLNPSGENKVVRNEIEELKKMGVRVFSQIYDASKPNTKYLNLFLNIRFSRVRIPSSQRRSMKSYLIKNKIDLIHIHNTFPLVELSLIEASMSLNIPIVYSIHNFRFACINGLFFREGSICTRCLKDDKQGVKLKCYKGSRLLSYLATNYRRQHLNSLKSASKILVLNNYAKNTLVSMGVDSSLIEMKRNFVSDYSEVTKPPTRDSKKILWVGRIDEAKGLRGLLANWLESNLPDLVQGLMAYSNKS